MATIDPPSLHLDDGPATPQVESVVGDLGHVTMGENGPAQLPPTTPPPQPHVESVVGDLGHTPPPSPPPPQSALPFPFPSQTLPSDYDFPKEWYELADKAAIPQDVDFADYDCPEDFLDDLHDHINSLLAQGVPETDPRIVASRKLHDEIVAEPPCCFFAEFYSAMMFTETGKFTNSDFSTNPGSSFGTGYILGGYIGERVYRGVYLGVDMSYDGGMSPTFTATNMKATGSAHAETLLFDVRVFPGQLNSALRPYTTLSTDFAPLNFKLNTQLYLEGGVGPSINTMSQLNGSINGSPSGTGPGGTQTQLAYQLGVGAQIDLSHRGFMGWSLDVGYRYRDLGNFSSASTFTPLGGSTISRPPLKTDVSSHNLTVGLGLHF